MFRLDIVPKPKQRPRFSKGKAYTPQQTRQYEQSIKVLSAHHFTDLMEGALKLELNFYFKRPKKPKTAFKESKPDLTNLIKAVEDGLEGVAYANDAKIVEINAVKKYASPGDVPHVLVCLTKLDKADETLLGSSVSARIDECDGSSGSKTCGSRARAKKLEREENRKEHRIKQAERDLFASINRVERKSKRRWSKPSQSELKRIARELKSYQMMLPLEERIDSSQLLFSLFEDNDAS